MDFKSDPLLICIHYNLDKTSTETDRCKPSDGKYMNLINTLIAGAAYIRVFIFYWHIKYHILNMLNIKCDINQQDLKRVDLHFVKSE